MAFGFEEALRTDVVEAARLLLGTDLVWGDLRARIVETEAYRPDEPASHSFRGPTPRNTVMFGKAGLAYVYFSYGCHWMLNVVAHGEGDAAAVLIRAARPLIGVSEMFANRPKARREEDLLSGPGKLCAGFGITSQENGVDLLSSEGLHLEPGEPAVNVLTGVRIGISQAKDLPWRFLDADALRWASRPLPAR